LDASLSLLPDVDIDSKYGPLQLTSTGAANALRLVIPEVKEIPFIVESVSIPISTGSLIILVINLQEEPAGGRLDRRAINAIYRST
jgi:glyceraldehyde 3-phosphate dehydrogenase